LNLISRINKEVLFNVFVLVLFWIVFHEFNWLFLGEDSTTVPDSLENIGLLPMIFLDTSIADPFFSRLSYTKINGYLNLKIHVCNDVDYAPLFSIRFKNYVVHELDLSINIIFNVLAIIGTTVVVIITLRGAINLIHPSYLFLITDHHYFDWMELLAHSVLLNCKVLANEEILLFLIVSINCGLSMAIILLSKLFGESYVELWFDLSVSAVFVSLFVFLMCQFDIIWVFIEVNVVKLFFIHFCEVKFVHFKNRILILNEFNVCGVTFTIISFI